MVKSIAQTVTHSHSPHITAKTCSFDLESSYTIYRCLTKKKQSKRPIHIDFIYMHHRKTNKCLTNVIIVNHSVLECSWCVWNSVMQTQNACLNCTKPASYRIYRSNNFLKRKIHWLIRMHFVKYSLVIVASAPHTVYTYKQHRQKGNREKRRKKHVFECVKFTLLVGTHWYEFTTHCSHKFLNVRRYGQWALKLHIFECGKCE